MSESKPADIVATIKEFGFAFADTEDCFTSSGRDRILRISNL